MQEMVREPESLEGQATAGAIPGSSEGREFLPTQTPGGARPSFLLDSLLRKAEQG